MISGKKFIEDEFSIFDVLELENQIKTIEGITNKFNKLKCCTENGKKIRDNYEIMCIYVKRLKDLNRDNENLLQTINIDF